MDTFPTELPDDILVVAREFFDQVSKDVIRNNADDLKEIDKLEAEQITISLNDDAKQRAAMWAGRRKGSMSRNSLRYDYYLLYLMAYENMAHLYRVSQDALGGSAGCGLEPVSGDEWLAKGLSNNFNHCRSIVERIASRLNIRHATMRSFPIKMGDLNAKKAAEMRDRIVTFFERQKDVNELKKQNSTMLPIFGTTFVAVDWDADATAIALDEEGNQVVGKFGDIKFRLVPPYRLHFPNGMKSIDETHWVIEDQLVTWGWLKERYPNIADRLNPNGRDFNAEGDDWVGTLGGFDERDIEDYLDLIRSGFDIRDIGSEGYIRMSGPAALTSNKGAWDNGFDEALPFRIHNCYERRVHPVLGQYWQFSRYCCGVELETKPLAPLERDPENPKRTMVKCYADGTPKTYDLPFVAFRYYWSPESFYGKSLVGDIIDILRALAVLRALLLKASVDSTNTYVLHKKDNKLSPFVGRILTFVRHRFDEPKFVKHQNQLGELMAIIKELEEQLDSVSMMPDVMRGENPNAGTSGRALEILAEGAATGFDNIAARNSDSYAEMYSKALDIYRFEVSADRLLPGLGENDLGGVLSFKGHDLEGGTDVQAWMDNSYSENMSIRRVQALADLQAGAISPDEYRDLIRGRKTYEFIDEAAQAENVAQRVIHVVTNMADEEATAAYNSVIEAVQAAVQQAKDPTQSAIAGMRAREAALAQVDLGIYDWEPIRDQSRYLKMWLNSEAAHAQHEDKVALIGEKWQALVDKGQRLAAAEMGTPPQNMPAA